MRYSFNFPGVVFLLLGAFFVSNVSAKENERWSTPDYLVDSFVEIALNNEYATKQSSIRKWTKSVKERAWNKLGNWRSIFVRIQGVAIGA